VVELAAAGRSLCRSAAAILDFQESRKLAASAFVDFVIHRDFLILPRGHFFGPNMRLRRGQSAIDSIRVAWGNRRKPPSVERWLSSRLQSPPP
jgi:hypothetical protein